MKMINIASRSRHISKIGHNAHPLNLRNFSAATRASYGGNTMKSLKTTLMKLAGVAALMLALAPSPAQAADKITEMVPMPDGIRLATDIYLPPGLKKKMPAVLVRTPYNKDGVAKMMMPLFTGVRVAMVFQDVRGRYASEGVSSIFIDDVSDGYETVEWLAKQPWSNGKIATAGISAMGITQYVMHKKPAEHLVCQNVMAAPESLYDTIVYQGGGVRRGLFYGWILGQNFPTQIMDLVLSQVDYSDVWSMMDLSPNYDKVNVPITHMAGWYDLYLPGNLNAFTGIRAKGGPKARNSQKLVIGPWTHGGFLSLRGRNQGELTYPENSVYSPVKIMDWFESCFADNNYTGEGKTPAWLAGPNVTYYVMGDPETPGAPGNEWRTADTWPVPSQPTEYFFHAGGLLSTEKPAAPGGSISFVDDPANPVPTLGSREHAEERHPVDLRPIESRSDVMTFSTPVLDAPVEVTGEIKAKIFFTTDVTDTDFNVRLVDVYPDGRSMLVTDGIARASHRESKYYRKYLAPGQTYQLDVTIWPTSLIFNKGHKIKVVISGTNFPRFDVNHHNGRFFNLSTGELDEAKKTGLEEYIYKPDLAADSKAANTTLHLGDKGASSITLPVVKAAK